MPWSSPEEKLHLLLYKIKNSADVGFFQAIALIHMTFLPLFLSKNRKNGDPHRRAAILAGAGAGRGCPAVAAAADKRNRIILAIPKKQAGAAKSFFAKIISSRNPARNRRK